MSQSMTPPGPAATATLRARHDGWTPDRQQRFVAALTALGSITAAAAAVGMSKRSYYKLCAHPAGADFRAACDAALAPPEMPPAPSLLDQAWQRETVILTRAGLGRGAGKGFGGKGVFTIDRPVPVGVLLRLLDRVEAKVMKARKRANSSLS